MGTTYAVTWYEADRGTVSGRLELGGEALRFEGAAPTGEAVVHELPYSDIEGVHVGRGADERVTGRPALVLERAGAPPVRVAAVATPGVLSELAEQVSALRLGAVPRTPGRPSSRRPSWAAPR